MRVALAQLNFTVGAFDGNYRKMADAAAKATAAGADLLLLSELATTGYPPRDLLSLSGFVAANLTLRDRVAALSTEQLGIVVGCAEPNEATGGKPLFNTAVLCHRGQRCGPSPQDTVALVRRLRRRPLLRARQGRHSADVQGPSPGAHGVRGGMERPDLLAAAALSPGSSSRSGGSRRGPVREHLVESLRDGQGGRPARHDPPARGTPSRAVPLPQSGRRQRRVDLRRPLAGVRRRRRPAPARRRLRRGVRGRRCAGRGTAGCGSGDGLRVA